MSFQFERSRKARADRPFVSISAKAAGALLLLSLAAPSFAQVSLTTLDTPYTQNFDALPNTGTTNAWTNNATLAGWYAQKTSGTVVLIASDGSSNTGGLYSFGTTAATERALGSVESSGTGTMYYGLRLANNTGSTITSLDVSYNGEQWRDGNATAQTVAFSYATAASFTGSLAEFQAAGTNVAALNFTSPVNTAGAVAVNGNTTGRVNGIATTITGLSIPAGTEVMLRWTDTRPASGSDHGLAIDDVSVTPHAAVSQPNLSINDVSVTEGDAGTATATFTVSLSQPAGAGGVTFDIATADGTASAGSDYVASSLTSQTIPAGSTTYAFNVTVNGDVLPEANETYFVNVTNVTGAVVTDGQGLGTIVDNDAPHLSIADVSHAEGNAGTTSYAFTVSLTQPAGPGGVTFDIATADGSATAPSDYTAQSLTGQTIPAGSTSYTFTVLVNGDTTSEPDEAFNVNVSNVANATVDDAQAVGTIVNDDVNKIHDVQGNGAATPIPGATVTVEGVVTAEFLGSAKLSGFFLQEEDADADADPNTSEAIFVFCGSCTAGSIAEGQRVRVTGVVSEFFNMTELTPPSAASVVVTDAGNHLAEVTPTTISLPVVGDIDAYYEAREGMLVTFVDTLTVSEFFELPRYGQIELLQGGRSRTFTEDNAPSVAGLTAHLDNLARRRVILDDDNNVQNSVLAQPNGQQAMYWPHQNGGFGVGTQGVDYFRGGDTVSGLTGVLHWSFAGLTGTDAWRIRPTTAHPVAFTPVNTRPATPPNVGGSIRVVGMNLLNYFTTIDTTSSSSSGPCGPGGTLDCRGADSVAELNRQRERASIVICTLNPDIASFMELENTTPSDTINDLLGAVNTRCGGAHPYAAASTGGTLGTDAIRVQIVYRTGVVSPVGSPLVDLDSIHDRPPTAQTFDVIDATNPAFGKRFTVVANHLKSKGSCPGSGVDADQGDGQGCWASKRTQQATRTMTWLTNTVIPAAGDPDVLLLGDFNSYASETPVTTLEAGGYADMETVLHGTNAYSYQFDGELGHLDYAFANASLQSQVTGADAWHINADEVPSFDYNDEIRDTGEAAQEEKPDGSTLVPPRVVWEPGTPYRASDHDPVVVGLFGSTDLAITVSDSPDPVTAGNNLTYTVTATNNGPATAPSASWSDTLPAGTSFVSLPAVAGWSCTTPAVGATGTINCSNASFAVGNAVFTLTVSVSSGVAGGTVLGNTVTITSSLGDSAPGNNSATATTTVAGAPQGHLTISPTSIPFGNQTVGTTSAAQTVTLGNDGTASLNVTALTPAAAPFARAGGTCANSPPITIAVGSSCTLTYTFAPAAAGAANQTLTVTANAPGSGTIALSGTGVPVTHTVTPSVGTPSGSISPSTPQTVNDGATTAFTLTANAGFHIDAVGGTCGGNLAGGTYTTNAVTADCTVIANFAADGGGGTFPPDENFDEVTAPALPAGWVTSTTTGNDFTTVTTAADTAPNAAFATDLPAINDFTLDSPSFTPAGTTTLTFRHQFNLEDTYDGAVLEISINGGPFTDIVTAGGSFGSGGYTDTISSGFNSPIAGRQAWSGSSGGFITTVATLPVAATGQPTKLRFRTADDSSVAPSSGPGWWVDSIHLSFATLPSVSKAFAPSSVSLNVDSTLTITLTNPTTTAATLTGNLVDTLPAGVVATAASATTTCTGGTGASNTSGSVTLATGAVIPANGSCVVAVTVHSASAGSYVNTIPAGALQTSIGNNDTAANATLTVTTPPVAVVTPNALSLTVAAGGTGSTPLNIANTGGSALTYTVSEGTTSINGHSRLQGNSYRTVSKAAQEMRAKYGPGSLSRNPKAGMPPAMRRPVTPLGSLQISQMADNSPGDEGVSCGVSGTSTTANSWWRRFYFSEHPGVGASTNVSSVTISSGSNGPSGVPVTINLYTIPHGTAVDTIPTASLTPIGTGTGTIDSGLVSVTIPVSGAIADTAGSDLVVEFHIEAVATGQFFPGANATTETHPTFLSAADCGVNEPTTASAIGFPNFHMTMVVGLGGTPPATCANPSDIPWLSEAPAGGSVAAGANTDVSVTANAASLAEGTYTANVCVGSNDPVTPLVTVPVTLTVGPAPFVLCPNNAEEIFCDGFDPAGGGGPATYTDRATFITHVAPGFYENDFSDLGNSSAAEPARSYSSGGFGYTVDSTPTPDDLWFFPGVMTTNGSADQIVVTFTSGTVTAVGGNFFASDIAGTPIPGNEVDLALSDGTTETFTTTDENDYRGFTTAAPITSITIDAPNPSDPTDGSWSTMDNFLVGTAN